MSNREIRGDSDCCVANSLYRTISRENTDGLFICWAFTFFWHFRVMRNCLIKIQTQLSDSQSDIDFFLLLLKLRYHFSWLLHNLVLTNGIQISFVANERILNWVICVWFFIFRKPLSYWPMALVLCMLSNSRFVDISWYRHLFVFV